MALPRPPITSPGFPSSEKSIEELVDSGAYVRTNSGRQGSWQGYLNALQKTPNYSAGNATFYETPADRTGKPGTPGWGNPPRPVRPLPVSGPRGRNTGVPVRGGGRANIGAAPAGPRLGATPAGRFGAATETRPGTPEANYAAGLRTYGASGRSAPNVGAVRNKAGYNSRDQRIAARNSRASLADGDEISRVRLLGG